MSKQAFEQGFYKRAAEYGISKEAMHKIDLSTYTPAEKTELLDILAPNLPKHLHAKTKHVELDDSSEPQHVNAAVERFMHKTNPKLLKTDGWHHVPLNKK